MHRLRCGNAQSGPIFANSAGKPQALGSIVNPVILPALNRCEHCHKAESEHEATGHQYKRDEVIGKHLSMFYTKEDQDKCDERIPGWHGWHAAWRGLGSNLYRLGVPDKVIQAILRHANVSTTATYYIKTAADDVRNAMAKLENQTTVTSQTQTDSNSNGTLAARQTAQPSVIQ
jgi:hypothetical protein